MLPRLEISAKRDLWKIAQVHLWNSVRKKICPLDTFDDTFLQATNAFKKIQFEENQYIFSNKR